MKEPPFDPEQANRWFAVVSNNRAWDLVELSSHTDESIDEMLHAAHTALWHWSQVGTAANAQRANCLLAAAYAAAGFGKPALRYAQRCLALTEKGECDLTDFDRAAACGCNARAASLIGETDQSDAWQSRMQDLAAALPEEDRSLLDRLFG